MQWKEQTKSKNTGMQRIHLFTPISNRQIMKPEKAFKKFSQNTEKKQLKCVALKAILSAVSSVQFSHSVVSDSLWPHGLRHTRPPYPSPTPGAYSNSSPLSRWCHTTISSSVVPFSSCPQSLPPSGSFPISQFFASGGQTIGVSASASVLPMNTQDWSPLGWTGWVSLQSKGLSRVSSNTTVQKHQFFSVQLSSESNSHQYMTIGKPVALTTWTFVGKAMSLLF